MNEHTSLPQLPDCISEDIDAWYSAIYRDVQMETDAFVIVTSLLKVHIIDHNGTLISKDTNIYKLDINGGDSIVIYPDETEDSFFQLIFSDANARIACADKLVLCYISSTVVDDEPEDAKPSNLSRSTSTLRRTELADTADYHYHDAEVTMTSDRPTIGIDYNPHITSAELICLYMHTPIFDESFTHMLKVFLDRFHPGSTELAKLIVSPVKEALFTRTLTNLSAFALYPSHTCLYTSDLIALLSIVNTFLLTHVTLCYELLRHTFSVIESPGAHLRGWTPRDDFSVERSTYQHSTISYLDVLQRILDFKVISVSADEEHTVLIDKPLVRILLEAITIYFDGICNIIGIFCGAPSSIPLKRFFDTSSGIDFNTILHKSLYHQLQSILESLFILLSGVMPQAALEPLIDFDPFNTQPTCDSQALIHIFAERYPHVEQTNLEGGGMQTGWAGDHVSETASSLTEATIYSTLALVFTVLDTFNAAAALDARLPRLVIPVFNERDSYILFRGFVTELEITISMLFFASSNDQDAMYVDFLNVLFGPFSEVVKLEQSGMIICTEVSGTSTDLAINAAIYNMTQHFNATVRPLIMILRVLTHLCKPSLAFFSELHAELFMQFVNCVLFISMDRRLDILHQRISAEVMKLSTQSISTTQMKGSLPGHFLLQSMEMMLRSMIQTLGQLLTDVSEFLAPAMQPALNSSPTQLSCYQMSFLNTIYLSDRVLRYSLPAAESPTGSSYIPCTDTCVSTVIGIMKQVSALAASDILDLSAVLWGTELLSHALNFKTDLILELTVFKSEIILLLLSLICNCLAVTPSDKHRSSDFLSSLSMGLEVMKSIDLKQIIAYAAQDMVNMPKILQCSAACCREQSRVLALFVLELLARTIYNTEQKDQSPSRLINIEESMTIHTLDLNDTSAPNQQAQAIISTYAQDLLCNIESLYECLQVKTFVSSVLQLSDGGLTFPADTVSKNRALIVASSSLATDVYSSIMQATYTGIQTITDSILPSISKDSEVYNNCMCTLSHIMPRLAFINVYQNISSACTKAKHLQPASIFDLFSNIITPLVASKHLTTLDVRLILMAIDAQSVIFRAFMQESTVIRETIAAYKTFQSLILEPGALRKLLRGESRVLLSQSANNIENMDSITDSSMGLSVLPIIQTKAAQRNVFTPDALVSYLNSFAATLAYVIAHSFTDKELQVLLLSAITSILDCVAPFTALQCEDIRFSDLVDLRTYITSGHKSLSEDVLKAATKIAENEVVTKFLFMGQTDKGINPSLESLLPGVLGSPSSELKSLGISLFHKYLIVATLKNAPVANVLKIVCNPETYIHLQLTLLSDTSLELAEPIVRTFDYGLQLFYELESVPTKKREPLIFDNYKTSYGELLSTLQILVSKDHMALNEQFYKTLFIFLGNLVDFFSRLTILERYKQTMEVLIGTLIDTVIPNYQEIVTEKGGLEMLYDMVNTLYMWLSTVSMSHAASERSNMPSALSHSTVSKSGNDAKDKQQRQNKSARTHAETGTTKKQAAIVHPQASPDNVETIMITICTLLLTSLQTLAEQRQATNDLSFKKVVVVLCNSSPFCLVSSNCLYIFLYTMICTISHIGLLKCGEDKGKELEVQIKCIVRLLRTFLDTVNTSDNLAITGEALQNVAANQWDDLVVLICVCLAIYLRNAKMYKYLIQRYEELARGEEGNVRAARWISVCKLVKRSRDSPGVIETMLELGLSVLLRTLEKLYEYGIFQAQDTVPTEPMRLFTTGPGAQLISLLLDYFLVKCSAGGDETLADRIIAYTNECSHLQRPSNTHAHLAIDIIELSMRIAPAHAPKIVGGKNVLPLLFASFRVLFPLLLGWSPEEESGKHTGERDKHLDVAHILANMLSVFSDLALIPEHLPRLADTDNQILLSIADFLYQSTHYYQEKMQAFRGSKRLQTLHSTVQQCMTMAALTLRNAVVTAEDTSLIMGKNISSSNRNTFISAGYQYIALCAATDSGTETDGFPAAAEYMALLIIHLIKEAEEEGADRDAIATVRKFALQLEKQAHEAHESIIQRELYAEHCSALLGALNMLPEPQSK